MPCTYCWSPVEGCEDPATAIRRADAFDMLDRHGYVRGDNEHTGRAILLISDLAHIYKGSLDHPFGPYVKRDTAVPDRTGAARTSQPGRRPRPARRGQDLLAALDIAAGHQRDRAEIYADCTGQTCLTCESRLQDAQAYDHLSEPLDRSTAITAMILT